MPIRDPKDAMKKILAPLAIAALLPIGLPMAAASASAECPDVAVGLRSSPDYPGGPWGWGYQPATVHPGDTLVWHIGVTNPGSCAGQYRVFDTLRANQSNIWSHTPDPWLSESPELASIEHGQGESVTITATVPVDAPLGDHLSMLWAYGEPTGTQVTQQFGVGIRVWLSVQP
jgi:hypothetical protein